MDYKKSFNNVNAGGFQKEFQLQCQQKQQEKSLANRDLIIKKHNQQQQSVVSTSYIETSQSQQQQNLSKQYPVIDIKTMATTLLPAVTPAIPNPSFFKQQQKLITTPTYSAATVTTSHTNTSLQNHHHQHQEQHYHNQSDNIQQNNHSNINRLLTTEILHNDQLPSPMQHTNLLRQQSFPGSIAAKKITIGNKNNDKSSIKSSSSSLYKQKSTDDISNSIICKNSSSTSTSCSNSYKGVFLTPNKRDFKVLSSVQSPLPPPLPSLSSSIPSSSSSVLVPPSSTTARKTSGNPRGRRPNPNRHRPHILQDPTSSSSPISIGMNPLLSSTLLSLHTSPATTSVTTANPNNKWHAPDSYIFDNILPFSSYFNSNNCDDSYDTTACLQIEWLDVSDAIKSIPTAKTISREQRIELHRAQLRRKAIQYILAQKFRNKLNARKRFVCVAKELKKLKTQRETLSSEKCRFPSCSNTAVTLTAHCYSHITLSSDQYLFLPCTAKFSDNTQCRVPVFDITHDLPLCRVHAWKRDNYNRFLLEQKPKKSSLSSTITATSKKRSKSISNSSKKRKQKRRKTASSSVNNTGGHVIIHHSNDDVVNVMNGVINNSGDGSGSSGGVGRGNNNEHGNQIHYMHQDEHPIISVGGTNMGDLNSYDYHQVSSNSNEDILNVCENSYDTSEDAGVALSETELMVGAHDVIEEIPLSETRLLEEHDLTNVLNQLPVDAFNELFTADQQNGPLEPTQEEQEELERALESVNKQVKSLQQMTGSDSAFLGDFLDVNDQMLDDTDICSDSVLNSPDSNHHHHIDTNNILSENSIGNIQD